MGWADDSGLSEYEVGVLDSGMTPGSAAMVLGRSQAWVVNARRDRLKAQYAAEASLAEPAPLLEVSPVAEAPDAVRVIVAKRYGGRGDKTPKPETRVFDYDEAKRLYEVDGLAVYAIGRKLGVSDVAVRKALKRMGVDVKDRRPRAEARRAAQEIAAPTEGRHGAPGGLGEGVALDVKPYVASVELKVSDLYGATSFPLEDVNCRYDPDAKSPTAEELTAIARGDDPSMIPGNPVGLAMLEDVDEPEGVPVRPYGWSGPRGVDPRRADAGLRKIATVEDRATERLANGSDAAVLGAADSKGSTGPLRKPLPTDAEIAAHYRTSSGLDETAVAFGVSHMHVKRVVLRTGGSLRGRGAQPSTTPATPEVPAKTARFVRWFIAARWTTKEIARLFDLEPASVAALR